MPRRLGQFRHKRYRCCARADDDDVFARIVKTFRPVLRMDNIAFEIFAAFKVGRMALLIFIIARRGCYKTRLIWRVFFVLMSAIVIVQTSSSEEKSIAVTLEPN